MIDFHSNIQTYLCCREYISTGDVWRIKQRLIKLPLGRGYKGDSKYVLSDCTNLEKFRSLKQSPGEKILLFYFYWKESSVCCIQLEADDVIKWKIWFSLFRDCRSVLFSSFFRFKAKSSNEKISIRQFYARNKVFLVILHSSACPSNVWLERYSSCLRVRAFY